MFAVQIRDLSYAYKNHEGETPILHRINIDIKEGELVAIQGPSGSGKSTLLYLLGCMLIPTDGKIQVGGYDLTKLSSEELSVLRNQQLGFIFQQFHLLPKTSVLQNVLLPAQYHSRHLRDETHAAEVMTRAQNIIEELGLTPRIEHRPNQLSGGQQQRVAIGRALMNDPQILLADEPTGNLDSKSALQIMQLFRTLNQKYKKTVIIITHDNEIASHCDRIIRIKDGTIENITDLPALEAPRPPQALTVSTTSQQGFFRSVLRNLLELSYHVPSALKNLTRNKVRTSLNMIGISVGIAAVLAMITLGQFTKQKILAGYAEMGVNTVLFYGYPNWEQKAVDLVPTSFSAFEWDRDIIPLKKIFPQINRMSPVLSGWDNSVFFGGKSIEQDVRTMGVNEEALIITNRELLVGRNFTITDMEQTRGVCIIGYEIGQRFFSNIYPIGQIIKVSQGQNTFGCKVIGVMKSTTSNKDWMKPNLQVLFPYTFYQASAGDAWTTRIRQIMIQMNLSSEVEKTANGLKAFFNQKYGKSGRFRADSDSVMLAQMNRFLTLFTILLSSIALITLTVGGIGITNMMLVSVSERFREIGLRKALGATDYSIRMQFLTESISVCVLAGALGLILGFVTYELVIWGASHFVTKITFEWTFNVMAFFISFVSILLVGLLSGLFPAMKAEKLQVIEALRSE